jgi:hypothetical protein
MKNDKNIDYMHPDGKPVSDDQSEAKNDKFDGRELEAAAKRQKNALLDADGHHICSPECQNTTK